MNNSVNSAYGKMEQQANVFNWGMLGN